jgi:hypothetical protein
MMPMTDVPVTAWWLLALEPNEAALIASGVATALAVLTRPNLVLLGLPLCALVLRAPASMPARTRRLVLWGLPAAIGPVAVAVIDRLGGAFWLRRKADPDAKWLIDWSLVWIACVVLSYLWYIPFDHWSYLRFLLPAFPMLLCATAKRAIEPPRSSSGRCPRMR